MAKRSHRAHATSTLDSEIGTILKDAPNTVALGYPAPYSVAASSLGAQTVYRTLNLHPDLACARFFLPASEESMQTLLITVEAGRPVSHSNAIAFSVSCETELLGVISMLAAAGLEPLAADRNQSDPPVIIGGPITFLDPRLVSPLSDIVVVGEAEESLKTLKEALVKTRDKNELVKTPWPVPSGIWIPESQQSPPPLSPTPIEMLPAKAATWSPKAELKNLFLVEATRGCKRGCSFCILSGSKKEASLFRAIPKERILESIPKDAPGVGLVGAAVTDHPDIEELVSSIVGTGKRVSLSSIRADRLTENLAAQLKRGGLRTLTIAADGCSDRLRSSVHKGITQEHLLGSAQIAKKVGIRGIKVYTMLGLPGEKDKDVTAFGKLVLEMARSLRITVAAQAFVPKPGTPLEKEQMIDGATIRNRLTLLRKITKGKIRLLPTSPRWSWLDWKLAHAGEKAALISIDAYEGGGSFSAWRKAVSNHLDMS